MTLHKHTQNFINPEFLIKLLVIVGKGRRPVFGWGGKSPRIFGGLL